MATSSSQRLQPYPIFGKVLHRPPAWQVAPNLQKSFHYAWMGLVYTFRTQRNFRIQLVVATVALGLGILFRVSLVEMAIVSLTCGLVMALELLNTALEAVVDLTVGQDYHVLAKIAKDCAAGAVLVTALVSVLVAGLLLLPPGWQWIRTLWPFFS